MVAVNVASFTRISVSSAGAAANNSSTPTGISGSGRYVTFYSYAGNLVGTDANNTYDVFVRDTATGITTLVSATADGSAGNSSSYRPSVSDDGRYVAFYSYASNLAGTDANNTTDVFVRDLRSGATFRISQATDGADGNSSSTDSQITGDGRSVVFTSDASNLVSGDGNGKYDVFVYDMLSGANRLVSVASDGSQGNGASDEPDISADSRCVVFESAATNLVAGDTNGVNDLFLRDLQAGTTTRVSLGVGGAQANGESFDAKISGDGRYVVFRSEATNLVAGDTNGETDVFLRDTVTGITRLISANTAGVIGNDASYGADISADGRYVVFRSSASNLVSGDTNGKSDIFLRDTVAGTTIRLSLAWNGAEGNASVSNPYISADGHFVTFSTSATNLVRGDTNGYSDVFRVSLVASDAADRMIGSDGADSLSGLGGADILDGGLGADTLTGGAGNDTFFVDDAGDRVIERAGGGFDSVIASVSYTLTAGQAIDSLATANPTGLNAINLTGNAIANTITGNDGANVLSGGGGADTLIGRYGADTYIVDNLGDSIVEAVGGGNDTVLSSVSYVLAAGQEIEALQLLASTGTARLNLIGNAFGQKIVGNNGANVLEGRGGNDLLIGRGGADSFAFTTSLGTSNLDHIADFASEDTIRLSKSIFSALATGELAQSAFKNISAGRADADDRILYKQATGELFYDTDGSGSKSAVKFAVLDNHAALTAADFFVV